MTSTSVKVGSGFDLMTPTECHSAKRAPRKNLDQLNRTLGFGLLRRQRTLEVGNVVQEVVEESSISFHHSVEVTAKAIESSGGRGLAHRESRTQL